MFLSSEGKLTQKSYAQILIRKTVGQKEMPVLKLILPQELQFADRLPANKEHRLSGAITGCFKSIKDFTTGNIWRLSLHSDFFFKFNIELHNYEGWVWLMGVSMSYTYNIVHHSWDTESDIWEVMSYIKSKDRSLQPSLSFFSSLCSLLHLILHCAKSALMKFVFRSYSIVGVASVVQLWETFCLGFLVSGMQQVRPFLHLSPEISPLLQLFLQVPNLCKHFFAPPNAK